MDLEHASGHGGRKRARPQDSTALSISSILSWKVQGRRAWKDEIVTMLTALVARVDDVRVRHGKRLRKVELCDESGDRIMLLVWDSNFGMMEQTKKISRGDVAVLRMVRVQFSNYAQAVELCCTRDSSCCCFHAGNTQPAPNRAEELLEWAKATRFASDCTVGHVLELAAAPLPCGGVCGGVCNDARARLGESFIGAENQDNHLPQSPRFISVAAVKQLHPASPGADNADGEAAPLASVCSVCALFMLERPGAPPGGAPPPPPSY